MPLKMSPENVERIRAAITPLDTPERRDTYRRGEFKNADKCKDLNMRYRWDLLYASKLDLYALFKELDDSHIDSALRQIVKPL